MCHFLYYVSFKSIANCAKLLHSCQPACDPMDCSMPGFPVHHYLPEFAQTHVHSVCDCQPATSSSVAPVSMGFPRQEYWRGLPFHFLRTFLTQGLIWEDLYGKVSQIYVCVHTHTHTHTTSPVAQMVKNLPAMQETSVGFLGWEDPRERG